MYFYNKYIIHQEVNNKFLINDYINIEGGIGYYFYLAEGGESETILNSNFSIDYDKHIYKNHYLSLEFSEYYFPNDNYPGQWDIIKTSYRLSSLNIGYKYYFHIGKYLIIPRFLLGITQSHHSKVEYDDYNGLIGTGGTVFYEGNGFSFTTGLIGEINIFKKLNLLIDISYLYNNLVLMKIIGDSSPGYYNFGYHNIIFKSRIII